MNTESSTPFQNTEISTAQKNMWLLNALDKNNTSYVITLAFDLLGSLNPLALEKSIQALLDRHPILKSYYPSRQGVPIKVMEQNLKVDLDRIDISDGQFSEHELLNYVNQLSNSVFDISKPPLIRFSLLKLSPQRHVFIVSMHHIISDGWSLGVLLKDLSDSYNAYHSNRILEYKTEAISYDEYVRNYDYIHSDPQHSKQKNEYWQEYLEGYKLLDFPYDHLRLPNQQFKCKKHEVFFDLPTTLLFEALCRTHSATLYMGLMTIFSFILMRYTGQNDLTLGTPVCNRRDSRFEHTIGLFVNSLVVRLRFEKNPSFLEALAIVREEMLNGLEHQDMPFEKLVELINPDRVTGQNPIFQMMFALQNAYSNTLAFDGVLSTEFLADTQLSRFDLESVFWRTNQGIKWRIVYNEDLISDFKCRSMAKHFKGFLNQVLEFPTKPLYSMAYLDSEEENCLKQLSQGANYPLNVQNLNCVHEYVQNNSQNFGSNVAIKQWGQRSLTFIELEEQSTHLAHVLLNSFLPTNEPIRLGIQMEPGIELAIVILGVLKAGMVVIPLNYDDPEERIQFILKNSNAHGVISDDLKIKYHRVYLYSKLKISQPLSKNSALPRVAPNDLAYIIFTSGTTGSPKGVMIEHRNLMNTLLACHRVFEFKDSDVFACASIFAFDIFFFEFFSALIAGGTTYLINKQQLLDPEIISQIIEEITCMHLVPGVANALLSLLQLQHITSCPNMRHFATGGDLVRNALLGELEKQFPKAEISVLYGPTETAILASRYVVNQALNNGNHPIGKPLDNTVILICDEAHNLQPIGIPGIMYIGGLGVARGYLNAPELNQDKFVTINNERYFKTGDLARWLPSYNIEFIGRIDNQIKIRGHRIELGEINTALQSHPAISEAVALVTQENNNKNITAYIVLRKERIVNEAQGHLNNSQIDQQKIIAKEIKLFLLTKLPHYMVPSSFEIINAFPLTKNGKLDTNSLLALKQNILPPNKSSVEPLNNIEQSIHDVMCQVLGLTQIGLDDNFFDRGANSLSSIQAAIKLRKQKLWIKPQDLFRYQSIAELSGAVHFDSAVSEDLDKPIPEMPLSEHNAITYNTKSNINKVLLLGATGFLGIHLLNQLLHCKVTIYCLIRSNEKQSALMRIKALYRFYFPLEDVDQLINKIVVIDGDVSFPNFKLSENEYHKLASEIDTVINAAANVNHVGEKEALIAVNVIGVKNIVEFARNDQMKTIHHVSTVGVKGLYRDQPIMFDETMLNIDQIPTEDYSHSKYDSELILQEYINQGGQANVYRVGTIGPNYDTGRFQYNIEQHFFSRYINSTIQLSLGADWKDQILDLTPVDSLATSILVLIFNSNRKNETFHLVSSHKLSYYDLIRFLQNCGYPIRLIDANEFKNKLFSLSCSPEDENSLTGIIQLLDSHESPHNGLCSNKTIRVLQSLGFHYPALTSMYLSKFISHGIDIKYFPKPRFWNEFASHQQLEL